MIGLYRCVADGIEIDSVFYVDARRRIIGRYVKDTNGNHYAIGRELACEYLRPRRVRLVRK